MARKMATAITVVQKPSLFPSLTELFVVLTIFLKAYKPFLFHPNVLD